MLNEIFRLSLPLVIGQLSFAFMSFIDTLLMGQLGVESLAGGGLGSVVYQFFYIVGIGALVSTANLIAFAKGREDDHEIHGALLSGCILVVVLFFVFGGLIWNIKPILLSLGQVPETVIYAERYLRVVVWALLPAFGFILLRSLVVGVGRPAAILPVSIVAAILNYPVSYALMTGQFGLPVMGIEGVALGTCIISWLMFFGLVFLTYRQRAFSLFPFWSGWQDFSWKQFRETLRLGLPIAIAHAMEVGMFSAAALLIGTLGVNALAAHQVALQSTTLSFMIPLGISQAVSVKVGALYGAQQLTRVISVLKSGLFLGCISAGIAAIIFWFAPEFLVQVFLQSDSVVEADYVLVLLSATQILLVAAVFQFVDSWQVIIMGALRGFKLGLSPTAASVVSYWCVGFPCSYFMKDVWGAAGVWAGMGVGLATSALILVVLFRRELSIQRNRYAA